MAASAERLAAIRAAVAKAAREKRQRETRPEDVGRLAGQYRGAVREFVLEWVENQCGYQRVFPRVSPGVWEDPTILSAAEVGARVNSGEWRILVPESPTPGAGTWCGSGSAHHVPARTVGSGTAARHTSHQRAGLTEAPRRAQNPDQRGHGRQVAQSAKFAEARK